MVLHIEAYIQSLGLELRKWHEEENREYLETDLTTYIQTLCYNLSTLNLFLITITTITRNESILIAIKENKDSKAVVVGLGDKNDHKKRKGELKLI